MSRKCFLILVLLFSFPTILYSQVQKIIVPISETLGCQFRQSSEMRIKTRLVKLSIEDSLSFEHFMSFEKILSRKRIKRKRLIVRRGFFQNILARKKIKTFTRRIDTVSRIILDVKRCRRKVTTLGFFPASSGDSCSIVSDTSRFNPRIINGAKCDPSGSPLVKINIYNDNIISSFRGSCSGTVVDRRAIITAAHCLPSSITRVEVVYNGDQIITSNEIFASDLYDGFRSDSDIGVIRLDQDIPIEPVEVQRANDFAVAEEVVIAGYGYIDAQGSGKNELGPSSGVTDGLYSGFMRLSLISPEALEANFVFRSGGSNTCNGDSGGPLMVYRNSQWKIAGIISNGGNLSCGRRDTSGFANITSPNAQEFLTETIPELF